MMLLLLLSFSLNDKRQRRRNKKKQQHTHHHLVCTTKCLAMNRELGKIKYADDYKAWKRLSSKDYMN